MTPKTVAVLGGGVAGLSAAHELIERGFKVTVYEQRKARPGEPASAFGGKARSMPVPGSGTGGRPDLPAEHGFRFFPSFYWHLPETMKRIPTATGTVADHLTEATEIMLAQGHGRNEIVGKTTEPDSLADLKASIKFLFTVGKEFGIPAGDLAILGERLLTLMVSCDERRFTEWENTSWVHYLGADNPARSEGYRKILADALTRSLVAAKGTEISARTGGLISCQLYFGPKPDGVTDRVLNGPTSEVWIDPWFTYLEKRGVVFEPGHELAGIDCDGRTITGVTMSTANGPIDVEADYYLAALPVERIRLLLSRELLAAAPQLKKLKKLETSWMNGMMFYLREDVSLVGGHAIFVNSKWALTAISQAQFWPKGYLERHGDGTVKGVLSVDISEWKEPGPVTGKVASACSLEEIREEVWAQLVDHIDDGSLDEANVVTWFLDPAIQFPNPSQVTNCEPLLINTHGSWDDRPEATLPSVPNLFLAADYVQTFTDLATMEGANEAARRAVNGILDQEGSSADRCKIRKPPEPRILVPFRALDRLRWRLKRPAKPPVRVTPDGDLKPTGRLARGVLAGARRFG